MTVLWGLPDCLVLVELTVLYITCTVIVSMCSGFIFSKYRNMVGPYKVRNGDEISLSRVIQSL